MRKIKQTDWHFRLLNKFDCVNTYWHGENLCKYFWKVVFFTLVAPVIAFFVAGLLTMPFWWWLVFMELDLIAFPLMFGALDIGILSGIWYNYREHLRDVGKLPPKVYKPQSKLCKDAKKEFSLFRDWCSARHRKVCPYLEFE